MEVRAMLSAGVTLAILGATALSAAQPGWQRSSLMTFATTTRGSVLGPTTTSTAVTMPIDHTEGVTIEIITGRADLLTRIARPGGLADVTPANAAALGGSFEQRGGPNDEAGQPLPVSVYRYRLPGSAVPAGSYTVHVAAPVAPAADDPVIVNVQFASPLTSAVRLVPFAAVVGQPVLISVPVAEARRPVPGATVVATVVPPPGPDGVAAPMYTVTLVDDGTGADAQAGDGLYCGAFTPNLAGGWGVHAKATGLSTGLAEGFPQTQVAFERTMTETIDVQPQRVRFATRAPIVLTEAVADRDGDGFFERLDISTDLEIREPGEYSVAFVLATRSGRGIYVSGRLDASDVPSIPAGSPPVVRTVTANVADWSLLAALPPSEWNNPTDPNDPDEAKTFTLTLRSAEVRYRGSNGDTLMDEVRPTAEAPVTLATRRVYDIDRPSIRPLPDGPAAIVPVRDGNDKIVGIQLSMTFSATDAGAHTFYGRVVNNCGVPLGEVTTTQAFLPETPALPIRPQTISLLLDTTQRIGPMGESGPFNLVDFAITTPRTVARFNGGPVVRLTGYPAAEFLNHHPFPDFNHNGITDYCDIFLRRDTDANNNNRADSGEGGCSPADIAQSDGAPGPDGSIDNGDFQAFFGSFFNGCTHPGAYPCALADIANSAGDNDPPGSPAAPDGAVDNGDFSVFFAAFFAGCP